MSSGKRFTRQSLVGQSGINLIERITLEMKSLWHPTVGPDIGIDGYIELCDRASGESLHLVIGVQSRATEERFTAETDRSLEYVCDERDLAYWLRGNLPVALIRSRPSKGEAYWVSVKEYFGDLTKRQTRTVVFDKVADVFASSAYERLAEAATPESRGLYLAPVPKTELLISNLLPVHHFAETIYVADTDYRDPKQLWDEFKRLGTNPGREWVLRNQRIVSFGDLRDRAWARICDRGSVEEFGSDEWATSDDADRRSEFVQLLKWALRCKLGQDFRWDSDLEIVYYPARWRARGSGGPRELVPYSAAYQGLKRGSSRGVFEVYRRPDGSVRYCRHYAFEPQFRLYEGRWFLAITPTYHFTRDGEQPDPYGENHMKGIKQLERNPAVLAALRLWAQVVAREDMTQPYPYLTLGGLVEFSADTGILDPDWEKREEGSEAKVLAAAVNQLPLGFEV